MDVRSFGSFEYTLAGFAVPLPKGYADPLDFSGGYHTGSLGFAVGTLHILSGTHFQGGAIKLIIPSSQEYRYTGSSVTGLVLKAVTHFSVIPI